MKTKTTYLSVVIFCLSLTMVSCEKEESTQSNSDSLKSTLTITIEEEEGLQFMREEEKLAQDVYIVLYELWGNTIFKNISESETTHTEAIKDLLDYYEIEDPAQTELGVFTDEYLQDLYDELVTKGKLSQLDALEVGELIEVTDIDDIANLIEETDNETIITVYSNLLDGSYSHLASFQKQLAKY